MLFRSRLVERIGTFDDRMRFVADLDYWLRAAAVTEIGHVDEVIALDRVHGGALSSVRRDEMADEERELRTSHGADLGTDAGRRQHTRSVRSEKIWARRLWLRFLRARLAPEGPNRPWNRFLADAGTSVSLPRIVAGQVPRIGYPSLRTAVRSSLAAEILGVPT